MEQHQDYFENSKLADDSPGPLESKDGGQDQRPVSDYGQPMHLQDLSESSVDVPQTISVSNKASQEI